MNQIKQLLILAASCLLIVPVSTSAQSVDEPVTPVIISEIKIKNDTTGFDEFIEITNISDTGVPLNTYQIEYFNTPTPGSAQQPVKAIIAQGILEAGDRLVLAKNKLQITDSQTSPFSSLSDSGGQIRLSDNENNILDQLSWTNTQSLAIAPINYLPTTSGTKSFHRQLDESGNLVVENAEWSLNTPDPSSNALLALPIPPPEPEPEPTPEPIGTDPENPATEQPTTETPPAPEIPAASLLPLQISELLPNPAPPSSDSTDEYIEIYNPNTEAIDLNGYRLQSGNIFGYNYNFNDEIIGPGEYKAFYVIETGVLLANSGGKVRLLAPDAQIISETSPYDDAKDGFAWSYINGVWQWTTSPTPNGINMLVLPTTKTTSKVPATPKIPKSKAKTSTAKVASAKKSTAKPKVAKTNSNYSNSEDEIEEITPAIHPTIIAGVGLIALAYAIYEYRHDLTNRIYQLKRYRETRREARAKA